ncbi:hypothetical protein HELRODRAFT_166669 [Helobdella robusta]|uniref:Uncharacterized protein n=1 Tax=Helobdella robusta TaxID=6412 RepID=T1EYC2_HELRO|nr:hypothetical protein HELRODRAFT_166669 [Helobdella robusta]ESO11655.1 hypothetical protein HELRODRAFT_166669 [Helobdella robusta]
MDKRTSEKLKNNHYISSCVLPSEILNLRYDEHLTIVGSYNTGARNIEIIEVTTSVLVVTKFKGYNNIHQGDQANDDEEEKEDDCHDGDDDKENGKNATPFVPDFLATFCQPIN